MGIRSLNKLLKIHCKKSINKIHLSELIGKTITIDTSIYLYRFKGENTLIESFYLMCNILKKYNIKPIFCFDGKPGKEKDEEINKRKEDKKKAKEEFNVLDNQIKREKENKSINEDEIIKIEEQMDQLRKQFIYIKKSEIEEIQKLLNSMGIIHITMNGEADKYCAGIVKYNNVYGCMSEDMDMFVYGCKNVFRYFSLINHTILHYSLDNILENLKMDFDNFQKICILSGSDYNKSFGKTIFMYYKDYKMNDLIKDEETDKKINEIRILFESSDIDNFDKIISDDKVSINEDALKNILENDNFIFPIN
jgi:5'-3' exonuclease